MRVRLFKRDRGVFDVRVEPGRELGLPPIVKAGVSREDLALEVKAVVDDVTAVRDRIRAAKKGNGGV